MIQDKRQQRTYLAGLIMGLTLLVLPVFALNILIDPLWFFGGNRLADKNFAFNERQAKLNRVLAAPQSYDCLIYGSSRTALLRAADVEGYRCFNIAVSKGVAAEFMPFARYLAAQGVKPVRVIVGVDAFNFSMDDSKPNLPVFVQEISAPPGVLKSYLSWDAFKFSLRTVMDFSPLPRYYNSELEAAVRDDAPVFVPMEAVKFGKRRSVHYSQENVALYRELAAFYHDIEVLAYVPPISAWHVQQVACRGELDNYLDAVHATSRIMTPLLDFSVPSSMTADTTTTYDGSHYDSASNHLIALILGGTKTDLMLPVSSMSRDAYGTQFKARLSSFLEKEGIAGCDGFVASAK